MNEQEMRTAVNLLMERIVKGELDPDTAWVEFDKIKEANGKSSKDIFVREIMTTNVRFITPEQTCEQALALMTDKHIRHLPVLQEDKLVGIVSIGDLVKAVIDEQKKTIDKLEKYTHSS